jgi:hypothetical protein
MTATGQIIAKGSDDYKSEFAWAYITYAASDHTSISAGRFRLPLFRYSDSADVGYSYHWATAPRSVYAAGGFNIEGLNIKHSDSFGDWDINSQISIGSFKDQFENIGFDGNKLLFAVADLQRDWFKVRAVAGRLNMNVSAPPLDAVLDQLEQIAPFYADFLRTEDDKMTFYGVSIDADFYKWFIGGEYTTFDIIESSSPEDVSYYVTAGVRFGKWTPSVTFESKVADTLKLVNQLSSVPVEVRPIVEGIVIGVQQPSLESYEVITLSTRYDWDANISLKWEVSRYTDNLDSTRDATLMNFAINYVF